MTPEEDARTTAGEDAVGAGIRAPRRTVRGEATRARIVQAAADLMFTRGVGGTSLDDVREASGTSKSQLYHYFDDKDGLVRAVIAHQTDRVLGAQEPLLRCADSLPGLRRWRDAVVQANQARYSVGGCPLGSLASELAEHSDHARELLAASFRAWQAHLVRGLQLMRSRGELEPDADPKALAYSIMTALQGGLLLAQTSRSSEPLERGLDMALEHVAARALPAPRRCETV